MDETATERRPERDEYLLGTDRLELERLREQHQAWIGQAHALWTAGGLAAGQVVLDAGCGPGYTTLELAGVVGPTGRVLARDRSDNFLTFLRAECARRGCSQVEASCGDVETLELRPGSLDAVYARWLLCWLPDPGLVLERAATALAPGGVVLLQEYLDWATLKLVPRRPAFDAAVDACMRSWESGAATIDVGEHVPALAARAGLRVERFEPVARTARPGSLVWRWVTGFFASYLPRLVERGLLDEPARAAAQEAIDSAARDERTFVCAPLMVDVVLRKP